MKLIRCYIENFGILHQYSLDFSEGVTSLCQENGKGKTTLTMFLQAMFYGLPRANKSLEKDLRRRYKPWQGGEYGGFLVFEVDETRYRLERYFGDRPSQDSFALYTLDPLQPSQKYDKDIGIALFGLDEESYARTSFIPQQMLGADLDVSGVTAGLTTMVENTADIHLYDRAMEALRQKRSGLLPYRGQGGRINQITERISMLQDSCYRLEQARQELPERIREYDNLEITLANLQEESEQLQEEISQTNEAIWKMQLHQQYLQLEEESLQLTQELQAMNQSYPRGFPSPEAVEDTLDTLKDLDQSLRLQYEDQHIRLKQHLELTRQHYEEELPDQESLEQMQQCFHEMLEHYDQLDDNQERLRNDYSDYTSREAKLKKMGFFIACAALSLIAALILFFFHLMVPGILFLTIALVLLIGVISNNQNQSYDRSEEEKLLQEQEELRIKIRELEEKLKEQLLQYFPASSSGQFPLQLQQLSQDLKTLTDGENELASLEEKIQKEVEKAEVAQNKLKQFCQQYQLSAALMTYRGVMQLKEDHIRFQNLQAEYRDKNEQLSAFLLDHGAQVKEAISQDPGKLPELKDRFRSLSLTQANLQNHLAEEKQVILQLKNKADQLPGLQDQIREFTESKKELQKEVRYLDLAILHLQSARESLTVSYLQKIKDAFLGYCRQLMPEAPDADSIFLGSDLSLSLDMQGAARELASFSAGTSDLFRFCMRLALVDALYPGHKPMLILDDPFVNLDAEHSKKAMELLHSLKDQQILYLTCHESRRLADDITR